MDSVIKYTLSLYLTNSQDPGWECLLTRGVNQCICPNGPPIALENK